MKGTKEYTNGEVTIVWKPEACIHSGICVKGLPRVFRPNMRPWITIDGAETEDLINQVAQCPSGALSYYINAHVKSASTVNEAKVEVLSNGPLMVHGTIKVINADGSTEMKNKTTAFCRCGSSGNKPYCDGSHVKSKFKG
ncbi:(4Fe-4S)-binding protein [Flavobacteriaceae bacterium GSB9]|nr:(4Fe-4S)-binding protein [Flavobacteriaceae bacterium GSB9]